MPTASSSDASAPHKLNAYLLKAAVVAGLGGLLFGFDTAVISGTTGDLTQVYNLSPLKLGVTVFAALVGGLVWAAVVITTRYDIGFLAWFVGAATGLAVVRVAGAPVSAPVRALAGVFAAGGIIVGKYVIFVHALNKALSVLSAGRARSVGYLNTHAMSVFVHNFSSIVRPVYALWVALAFFAAIRTAGGRAIYTRRRR